MSGQSHIQDVIPITVMILTKNEETGIAQCIESLRAFDQVVVVDSMSSDRTREIGTSLGAEVVTFEWDGQYPKKKQWMLERAPSRNDWILILDADERPTRSLLDELRNLAPELENKVYAAYDITLDYVYNGRLLRYGHRVVKRSLLDRTRTHFEIIDDLYAPGIGEVEGHYQPVADGPFRTLSGRILHDDQDPIRSWFDRHNRYSDWEAYLRLNPRIADQVNRCRSGQGQVFARSPFKPLMFFLYDYFLKQGFRDGRAGLNYAIALSWYYWLIDVKVAEALHNAKAQ